MRRLLAFIGIASILCFFPTGVCAQDISNPGIKNNLRNCYRIQNDKDRLACFDSLANTIEVERNENKRPSIEIPKTEREQIPARLALNEKTRKDERTNTKENSDTKENGEKSTTVTSKLEKARQLRDRRYRFYLANGQVWEQKDSSRIYIPKKGPITVTIKKGSFGSYILKVNSKKRAVRVKRIK